jgi:diguanylate cyclase (GGDEF)-like protein
MSGTSPTRARRLDTTLLLIGAPAALLSTALAVWSWPESVDWAPIVALAALALIARYYPAHISYTNISLGVGFLLAAALMVGPAVAALVAAVVHGVWSLTRGVLPWFGYVRGVAAFSRAVRAIYAAGLSGLVYYTATAVAFSVFALEPPVDRVTAATIGASVLLTVGVYLAHNLSSLLVSHLVGDDVSGPLRSAIPSPALAEFLALPAALLLVVVHARLGWASFSLLAWLYLTAAFLGWRSWRDRESIRQRLEDVELLHRAGATLTGTLEMGELVRRLHSILRQLAVFDSMLLVIDDDSERLSQVFAFDATGHRGEVTQSTLADAADRPEGLFAEPGRAAVFTRDLALGESANVRLRLDFPCNAIPSAESMVLLETICQQAGTALANARLYRLANTDPLTGVALRRYFERALRLAADRAEPFAAIMLDLDWFKRINDSVGHKVGDLVLVDLATILLGSIRAADVVARYGGEEFVILLPGSSSPEAAAVAERIRRTVECRVLSVEDRVVRYTASFGIAASADLDGVTDPMEVLWKADEALLEAKRAGRNQVITYVSLHQGTAANRHLQASR